MDRIYVGVARRYAKYYVLNCYHELTQTYRLLQLLCPYPSV